MQTSKYAQDMYYTEIQEWNLRLEKWLQYSPEKLDKKYSKILEKDDSYLLLYLAVISIQCRRAGKCLPEEYDEPELSYWTKTGLLRKYPGETSEMTCDFFDLIRRWYRIKFRKINDFSCVLYEEGLSSAIAVYCASGGKVIF